MKLQHGVDECASCAPSRSSPNVLPDPRQARQHEPNDVHLAALLVAATCTSDDADLEACRQAVEPRLARLVVKVDEAPVRDVGSRDRGREVGEAEDVGEERVQLVEVSLRRAEEGGTDELGQGEGGVGGGG